MVTPTESMNLIKLSLERSDDFPDDVGYVLHEVDMEGDDSDVDLPAVEIEPITADHVNPHNTDLVGYVTDEDGNRTGRIFYAEYELTVEVDIWLPTGGKYDVDDLGNALRDVLYQHSSYGPQEPFRDEDGRDVDSIFRFDINEGERQDEIIRTPTLRRWRHEVEIWGYEEFHTSEEYVVDVVPPDPNDPEVQA